MLYEIYVTFSKTMDLESCKKSKMTLRSFLMLGVGATQ